MKTAGATRTIDNLGKIAIPKVIRDAMKISEGTIFQFFIEKDKIVLKKFDRSQELKEELLQIIERYKSDVSVNVISQIAIAISEIARDE